MSIPSSLNLHYLAGVLDKSLSLQIRSDDRGKIWAEIHGYRSLLSFAQSLFGGRAYTKRTSETLKLNTTSLYKIAETLCETPCLLQPIYQQINKIKVFKNTFDPKISTLTEYQQKNQAAIDILIHLKQNYLDHQPNILSPDLAPYQAGYIEAAKWLEVRLTRTLKINVGLRSRLGYDRIKWMGLKNVNGQAFCDFITPLLPYMSFRRQIYEKAVALLSEDTNKAETIFERYKNDEETWEKQHPLLKTRSIQEIMEETQQQQRQKREEKIQTKLSKQTDKLLQIQKLKETKQAARQQLREIQKKIKQTQKEEYKKLIAKNKQERIAKKAEALALVQSGWNTCRKCEQTLTLENFNKAAHVHTGYSLYCKKCCWEDHYLPNRTRYNERAKAWIKAHPEEIKISRRREQSKPHRKIRNNIRMRLIEWLNDPQNITYKDVISCSPKQIVTHLESQFTPQMTWSNYGTYWHIDHIVPCAAFNHTHPLHLKWCWHHKNLRPLEAQKNLDKRDILPCGRYASTLKKQSPIEFAQVVGQELEKLTITTQKEFELSLQNQERTIYLDLT